MPAHNLPARIAPVIMDELSIETARKLLPEKAALVERILPLPS
jgi:hypothetical protein